MNKRLSTLTTLIALLILCGSAMDAHAEVVGYWSFDDPEQIGKDSSLNHNHGELKDRDRAKWVWSGRVGGALQLDSGSGLEVPHDESLNLRDQLTLMCWVKFAHIYGFARAQRSWQQSLIWKSAPGGQVSYGLYANRGQLELNLPLYVNRPGVLFSWLYVIDPKCEGQFINGIPDFPARCQRKFAFGLGDSKFGNLGFRASMPGAVDVHAVHPTFFVNFFPVDNFLLNEDEKDFLKKQEQDFVQAVSNFMIGTSNIYLPRIIRHFENFDEIWFHFAAVADGHSIRLYVNGKEKVSERQGSDRQPEPFINSQEPLMIGTGLDGIIDEVMLLDHALTEDEIREAMELGKTRRSLGFLSNVDVEITEPPAALTPVVIPDSNLARYLRTDLGLPRNAPITRYAMQQLRELRANRSGIKDLTGLEHATNLERLELSGNQISDVSVLAGLTNLHVLWLTSNQISDVSVLAGLTNLERLELSGNQISDVLPLAGLMNLERLSLSGNQISDFSPLAGLTNLEQLFLGGPQSLDFSPLAGLTNLKLLLIGHTNSVHSVVFSPDGQTLASGGGDTIRLWDPKTGQLLRTLTGHTFGVWSVSFSPDGQTLASGDADDGTVRLWNVKTGEHLRTLTGHTSYVYSVSFSPDGQTLASGSRDKTVRLWNVNTGEHLRTLRHTNDVGSVSFSPDGQTLASAGDAIRLWDANTGRLLRTLIKHTDWFYGVSFSPDGSTLASGGFDGAIRLWDANTGRLLRTLTGHTYSVKSVSFNPDGNTLASGSNDKTVRLWDVNTGQLLRTLEGHTGGVTSVSFSSDGQTLATGSGDATVLLWELASTSIASERIAADVNGDGNVNIQDLVFVASNLGTSNPQADVNADGVVNVADLVLVAGALGDAAAAPSAFRATATELPPLATVEKWLTEAYPLMHLDARLARGIAWLERLLAALAPEETALLPNYPNPFNPETWIPYQLAAPTDVMVTIYAVDGTAVRTLALGHQSIGIYQGKSRAAYWDGRNDLGEPVASGVYFYTLTAGDFTATRKMLIRK